MRAFRARMDAFPEVAAFIGEVCAAAGVSREDTLRLTLIIEELFTNTVVHGHGGDSDEPVQMALDIRADRIAVLYEDTAPVHDPFRTASVAADATASEAPRAGGLGVPLVAGMATEIEHSYASGRNRVAFVLTLSSRATRQRPDP